MSQSLGINFVQKKLKISKIFLKIKKQKKKLSNNLLFNPIQHNLQLKNCFLHFHYIFFPKLQAHKERQRESTTNGNEK